MSIEKSPLRRKLDKLFVPLTVGPTLLWIAAIIVYPTRGRFSAASRTVPVEEMEFVRQRPKLRYLLG